MDSNRSGGVPMPSFYRDTYHQYKQNDQKLLLWVHQTVAKIRRRPTVSPPPRTSTPRGRAQKSKGGPKRTHPTIDPDFSSPKIPFDTFVRLVKEIAASNADIPVCYVRFLYLSIRLRKRIAGYYSPDAEVSDRNSSHVYAIRRFTEAWEILNEEVKRRTMKDGQGKWLESLDIEDNGFLLSEAINEASAALDEVLITTSPVDSADNEWIRDNPLIQSSAKAAQKHEKLSTFPLEEYELVMGDYVETKATKSSAAQDDSKDALRCFLIDVWDMRKYCNVVWNSVVPVGKTSHIAASFVTNRAVQLVKEMEYALLADFPSLKDIDKCYEYLDQIIEKGMDSIHDDQERDQASHHLYDQTMAYTFEFLVSFGKILQDGPTPMLREGVFGHFDPLADRDMPPEYRIREQRCVLGNHLPDIIVANMVNQHRKLLGTQGLVQDFKKFCDDDKRNVSWALIFACQMQVDSVLARRRYLDYDLSVMHTLGKTILTEYEAFAHDHNVLYGPLIDKVRPSIEGWAAKVHNSIEEDLVTQFKLKHGYDKPSLQPVEKDSFWKLNSWLTANVIAEATLDFFNAGLVVAGASGLVKSAMQLWNMLRQTGYLPPSVTSTVTPFPGSSSAVPKDHVLLFDHLIDVFGHGVFSGNPPKNKFLNNWEIMMGARLEMFARGTHKPKKGAEYKRPLHSRGKGTQPTTSELFNMHQAKYFSNRETSTANKTGRKEDRKQQKHPLVVTFELVNSELGQSASLASQPPPSASASDPRGPLLNINLFKVHRLCMRLFAELEPALIHDLERILGFPLSTETQGPFLTGSIAATEAKNHGKPHPLILQKAADVVSKIIGDEELGPYLIREEGDDGLVL